MGRCSQPEARSPQNHLTLLLKVCCPREFISIMIRIRVSIRSCSLILRFKFYLRLALCGCLVFSAEQLRTYSLLGRMAGT